MSYLQDPVYRCVEQLRAPGTIADRLADAWHHWHGAPPDDVAVAHSEASYDPFEGATLTAEASVVPSGRRAEAVRFGLLIQVFANETQLGQVAERARFADFVSTAGPPFFTLPTLRTAAWTLPNGPGPRALQWAMVPANLVRLAKLDEPVPATHAADRRLRVTAFRPTQRAELRWQESASNDYVLKVLTQSEATVAEANYRTVEAVRSMRSMPFALPELIAHDRDRHILVLRQPRGRSFERVLQEPFREPFERLGTAVAFLHSSSLRPSTRRTPADRLAAVEDVGTLIVRAIPELSASIGSTLERLRKDLPRGGALCPTHGALDGDTILYDAGGLGIVDWDEMASAHPYTDLASVVAHTVDVAIDRGLPSSVTRACVRAMTTTYRDVAGAPIQRPVFAWHTAAALLERAGSGSLRQLSDRWHQRVIGLAGEALGALRGDGRYVRTI